MRDTDLIVESTFHLSRVSARLSLIDATDGRGIFTLVESLDYRESMKAGTPMQFGMFIDAADPS